MRRLHIAVALGLTGLLALACSTAPRHSIDTETLSSDWQGQPFKDVLVVGVYEDRAFRVSSESIFASELSAKAVAAAPSYDLIPDLSSLDDKAAIRRVLQGTDFDSILTVTLIDAGPDFDRAAYDTQYTIVRLLGSSGSFTRIGGAIDEYESGKFVLDFGFWDAATLENVWHAASKSYSLQEHSEQVSMIADFMIETLRERGLI